MSEFLDIARATEPPSPSEEPFRVTLIVSSELTDGSWNQIQHESVQEIEAMSGSEVSYSELVDIPDKEAFR